MSKLPSSSLNIKKFSAYLRARVAQGLPGDSSHQKMTPQLKGAKLKYKTPSNNAKKSAVMLLIYENNDNQFEVLLTLRSSKLRSHSGQISFPGGRADDGETVIQTALRETFEEVGIRQENITVVENLSQIYLPPSNSLITPVVGILDSVPNLILSEDEVEEAFFVRLNKLLFEDCFAVEEREMNGMILTMPCWNIHPNIPLWGATAIILRELLDIYEDFIQEN